MGLAERRLRKMSAIDPMTPCNMILQGDRKRDELAVNGDAGHSSTQVAANKLTTRTTPM